MKYSYSVGIIASGLDAKNGILVVENDGVYSLPEISVDASKEHNIVSTALELANSLNLQVEQKGLAYVLEQKIPDKDEVLVTYYFLLAVTGADNVPEGYYWAIGHIDKLDESLYPAEFVKDFNQHLLNGGWLMGDIKIIK